jgi:hypothetical protein
MVHIADPVRRPSSDRVAMTHEFVRVVRVETLHAVGRSAADATRAFEAMKRIATAAIIGVGRSETRREFFVLTHTLRKIGHHTGRLESSDGLGCATAGEPVERRERLSVDERERLDHRRESAAATHGDTHLTTQSASDLTLDGDPVFVRDRETQPSLFRTFRLISA